MNKKLIALAVAGVLTAPLAAQAETKVYGKVHLSYGSIEEKDAGTTTEDNWQLRSHASRVGVKGSHDLGNGLAATYKFEWEVDPDSDNDDETDVTFETGDAADNSDVTTETLNDGGTAGFKRRSMYAGLKGGFGEVRFGRHDTPLKLAQGKFDQFNDTDADIKHSSSHDGEHRLDNVLVYMGKSGNISYAIAGIPAEGDGKTSGDGPVDTISASLTYKDGPLYVAVAHDSYDNETNAAEDSLSRLVGIYKMGGMQFGLLYQTGVEKPSGASSATDTIGVSFAAKAGKGKFKAQYLTSEDDASTAKETTVSAIGYEYKMGKKVSNYIMWSNVETEKGGPVSENSFVGAGLVVKF